MRGRLTDRFDELVPPNLRPLEAYQPGKPLSELSRELGIPVDGIIKIASNENPLGPSPRAIEATRRMLHESSIYPDNEAHSLRHALASRLGVDPAELVFGSGSNELIHLLVRSFCRPGIDRVVTHRYAFLSYRQATEITGALLSEAEVKPDLSCDADALIAAMTDDTRIVLVANPNNPTGAHLTRSELERIVEALPEQAILVLDEAYHEYAAGMWADYPSSQPYRQHRPLLVTLRTFSKAYGLAGMQIGYGIADRRVVNHVNRVRRPFNVSSVAQAAALAALEDTDHVARSIETARTCIAALTAGLTPLGIKVYPSLANFVLMDVGRESVPVYQALLRQGVIVRPMGGWGLPRCLRVSVCTTEQTDRVLSTLSRVLAGC